MTRPTIRLRRLVVPAIAGFAALLALPSSPVVAQTPTGLPQGVTREQMWPAPTAEDWKRPCLIQWQRSWEDAQAISRETGRAILVCVNMDGEIASEHYAGVRYRQPDIAKLYEPYVCVIASVYRHTPRDHDDQGQRVLCPRFGTVTCGEHIAIEPGLYDKYFDGERVAPRHIGVELDGKEMYDVFYAWDTDTIFNSLRDGIANRKNDTPTVVRGDRPIVERVASRDVQDRIAVESAYQQGDAALRRSLLEAAAAHKEAAPTDLLRLALFGFDPELSRVARSALAQTDSPDATGLIGEAMRVPMEPAEREALIGALSRLGESSPRARTLAAVNRGLGGRSGSIDVDAWTKALAAAGPVPATLDTGVVAARIERQDEVLKGEDTAAHLDLAEAFLARAFAPDTEPDIAHYLLVDARNIALKAEKLGAYGWRVNAAIATADWQLGDRAEATTRAEAAMGSVPADAAGRAAMIVLGLFAEARWQAISKAAVEKKPWPPEWLSDVHAAFTLLARHPLGSDGQVAGHYDVLKWLGAAGASARILDDGLARFPDSAILHDRLRARILEERGRDGLEPEYEQRLAAKDASPDLAWFAGYASFVTAEFERRANEYDPALAAYDRAIAHFERNIAANPDARDSADRVIALALAGRARIAFERGDDDGALAGVLAALARKPEAAATDDGLGISPVGTAKALLQRLTDQKKVELVAKLQAALDALDPELLQLPAYERDVQGR